MAKGLGEIYVDTIKRHFHMHAVWKPGRNLNLGDYGILRKERFFSGMGNIKEDFGVNFKVKQGDSQREIDQFISRGGFQITSRAKGAVSPGGFEFARAGVSINFTHGKAVFVDAHGCYYDQITSIPNLGKKIIKEYKNGKGDWKEKYVLVTQIERAKGATVVITTRSKASIDIEAKVGGAIKVISDPSLGLRASKISNIGYRMVAKKGLNLSMEIMAVREENGRISFVSAID
jgi:hypothetical protein